MRSLTAPKVFPLRVAAELSSQLSRGLWLVKWLLVSPASPPRPRTEAVASAG